MCGTGLCDAGLPLMERIWRVKKRTLFKLAVGAYVYRLVIASVYLAMAFAISNTDTQVGVASEFAKTGLRSGFVQFGVFVLFIIGGGLVVLPKHRLIDLVIISPLLIMSWFSLAYAFHTGNITAPTAYLTITFLVVFLLIVRWQNESIA